MQLLLLKFVQSIRERSFSVYIQCMLQFSSGHFVVQKKMNVYSAVAIDQCHEQANALIRSDGGAVVMTLSPQASERWMVAALKLRRYCLNLKPASLFHRTLPLESATSNTVAHS